MLKSFTIYNSSSNLSKNSNLLKKIVNYGSNPNLIRFNKFKSLNIIEIIQIKFIKIKHNNKHMNK